MLDPFFVADFAPIAGVTWEAVYAGDRAAIDKAMAWALTTSPYTDPAVEIDAGYLNHVGSVDGAARTIDRFVDFLDTHVLQP